jgi:hypothetical protein
MFKDDKPLAAANDTAKVSPVDAAEGDWAMARAEDDLFEDILDIEGPVRSAMTTVAGFTMPGIEDLESGITLLEGRIPDEASTSLNTGAARIRKAVAAGDAAEVRAAQSAVVEMLVALRQSE